VITYVFRLLEIFVYSVIAFQCMQLWNLYSDQKDDHGADVAYAVLLGLLYVGVVVGFVVAIAISAENAWRILYW
jgi:hypothetical protein